MQCSFHLANSSTRNTEVRTREHETRGVVYVEAPESVDDLKLISGIAAVSEKRLNEYGIYTFKQIMHWEEKRFENFRSCLRSKIGLIETTGSVKREHFITKNVERLPDFSGSPPGSDMFNKCTRRAKRSTRACCVF